MMGDAYQPAKPAQQTTPYMPLRTYIAVEALSALLSTGENYTDDKHPEGGWEWYADAAIEIADLMIKKLEK